MTYQQSYNNLYNTLSIPFKITDLLHEILIMWFSTPLYNPLITYHFLISSNNSLHISFFILLSFSLSQLYLRAINTLFLKDVDRENLRRADEGTPRQTKRRRAWKFPLQQPGISPHMQHARDTGIIQGRTQK